MKRLSKPLCIVLAMPVAVAQAQTDRQVLEDFGLVEPAPAARTAPPARVSAEPQQLVYDGAPLAVTVNVGRERRLVFETPVRISAAPEAADALEPEIYGASLLLVVNRPLTTRLQAQLADGEILPIDLHAVPEGASDRPLAIVRRAALEITAAAAPPAVPVEAIGEPPAAPSYVDLVRHAAQRLYAPERLIEPGPGLHAVPVATEPVRLLRWSQAATRPVAGWERAGLYVTAVRVTSLQDAPIVLDPRRLVGRWRAAAFQHRRLPARGETALYLVSDRPFAEAIGTWGRLSAPADEPQPVAPGGGAER